MSIVDSRSSVAEESTTDKERRRRRKVGFTSMDLQEHKHTGDKTLRSKNAAPQTPIVISVDNKKRRRRNNEDEEELEGEIQSIKNMFGGQQSSSVLENAGWGGK